MIACESRRVKIFLSRNLILKFLGLDIKLKDLLLVHHGGIFILTIIDDALNCTCSISKNSHTSMHGNVLLCLYIF